MATLVRIYLVGVSNPDIDFESIHSRITENGLSLRTAFDRIRNASASADAGTLFNWQLLVVG